MSLGRRTSRSRATPALESGEMDTVGYMAKAKAKKVTDRFVSRTTRLAYLSPEVLKRLVIRREPHALSWNDLVGATYLPWAEQTTIMFEKDTHKLRTG